jgi:dTDP-4-dehydrorhamnose 3,5-epimerase
MMEMESGAVQLLPTDIPEIKLIIFPRHYDDRGFVSETYNQQALSAAGILTTFVQDDHSCSARAGTLRGLHFQAPPRAQAKLVQVPHGAVLDIAVDLRHGSPTLGRYVIVELSASNWRQLFSSRLRPRFYYAGTRYRLQS